MMTQRTHTRATQTEAPPKELLDYGKLEAKAAAIFGGLVLLFGIGAALLLSLAWLTIPKEEYTGAWQMPNVPQLGFILAFVAGAWVCAQFARRVSRKMFAEWEANTLWVEKVRTHWLDSSRSRNGLAELQTGTELTLKPNRFNDLVVTVVAIQAAVDRGEPTPWILSVLRGEDGPLGLKDGSRESYFGSFSPKGAELAADALSSAGLIVGRKQGYAGRWTPRDLEEALSMLTKARL